MSLGSSPHVPSKRKGGINEKNESEQLAGTVHECSNEISWQGNDNDYHFKGTVTLIFLMALFSSQSFINTINFRDLWLVMSILFVLEGRLDLMTKRESWLFVLVRCPIEKTHSLLLL